MIKRTVTYVNYDGENVTEDLYFHLTKAELTDLQTSVHGGFAQVFEKALKTNDTPTMMKMYKDLLLRAYGIRTNDGRFKKPKEEVEIFASSEAFSVVYMELLSDDKLAVEFFNGLIPKDLADAVRNASAVV